MYLVIMRFYCTALILILLYSCSDEKGGGQPVGETPQKLSNNLKNLERNFELTERVEELSNQETLDLDEALIEVDLMEIELRNLNCEFNIRETFRGMRLIQYDGEISCPRLNRPEQREELIFIINSFLFLAENLPRDLLDINTRSLLDVKVREMRETHAEVITQIVSSLENPIAKYMRYSSRFNELNCLDIESCEVSGDNFNSLRTITNECSIHYDEVIIYRRIWPVLGDINYLNMRNFFDDCRSLIPAVSQYEEAIDTEDIIVEEEDSTQLILEYSCYSTGRRSARNYCSRMEERFRNWVNDSESLRDILAQNGIEVIRFDTGRRGPTKINSTLILFQEFESLERLLLRL